MTTEPKCENCHFFQKGGRDGLCRNVEHAETRWVGGGSEYSSSAQALTPVTVWATQWCELHEPERPRVEIRPVTIEEKQARWQEEQVAYQGMTTATVSPLSGISYMIGGRKLF